MVYGGACSRSSTLTPGRSSTHGDTALECEIQPFRDAHKDKYKCTYEMYMIVFTFLCKDTWMCIYICVREYMERERERERRDTYRRNNLTPSYLGISAFPTLLNKAPEAWRSRERPSARHPPLVRLRRAHWNFLGSVQGSEQASSSRSSVPCSSVFLIGFSS